MNNKRSCKVCGLEFIFRPQNKNQKYCSQNCKNKDKKNDKDWTKCSNCNKDIYKSKSQIRQHKNLFCSKECEYELKYKHKHEIRECEICNVKFNVLKSSKKRFCSIKCQSKWQSTSLVGENANNYNHNFALQDRTLLCEWCSGEFVVNPYQIDKSRFCSENCRRNWFAHDWSQSIEWKEESRKRAVEILESGVISNINSGCQVITNDLLEQLGLNYSNEKNFKYFSVDVYLEDFNLIIEVMGGYWHVDNRLYDKINYDHQVNRIKQDKAKNTYIKKYHNIKILYLWEYDIINHYELCKELINYYVSTNGLLKNYHSFNYSYINNLLILNNELLTPYMELSSEKLNTLIDLSVKQKRNLKQADKWITFKCQSCGKEKQELLSHYKKKKNHFCSNECHYNFRRKSISFNCQFCGKETIQNVSNYQKRQNHYCSRECSYKDRKNLIKQ